MNIQHTHGSHEHSHDIDHDLAERMQQLARDWSHLEIDDTLWTIALTRVRVAEHAYRAADTPKLRRYALLDLAAACLSAAHVLDHVA